MIVVLYAGFTITNPMPGIRWAQEKYDIPASQRKGGVLADRKASITELKALLHILDANSAYIPSTYKPRKTPAEEDYFKVSVLFPIGPLSFNALEKLNLDTGCAICGEKSVKKCSSCQSVEYCGRGLLSITYQHICA